MVVDTSALVAILKVEPDASTLLHRLGNSGANRIATATLLEAQMVVISQLGEAGVPELELLMNRAQIQVVPFNADHMRWALHGWRHYGKGRHRAALNLGDCFSYGLAKAMDTPLLFKGEDFQYTDVKVPA
ncbi:MAG: type II toxin-antitoxin system VapC family toxin [Synechococcaceae bacterium WB9_4xC_028]|nr:type II toxin-antitoxin system VapC family toxin [Synechococcaceae bacterium WB9_4xC_028]